MNEVNKVVKYNSLLNVYGELLSNTQKEILSDYYNFNLSISEIAESRQVSRAAVEDAIKKGEKKLDDFEKILGFCVRNSKISFLLDKLKKEDLSDNAKSIIDEIEKEI